MEKSTENVDNDDNDVDKKKAANGRGSIVCLVYGNIRTEIFIHHSVSTKC